MPNNSENAFLLTPHPNICAWPTNVESLWTSPSRDWKTYSIILLFQNPNLQNLRLRGFSRVSRDIGLTETSAFVALERAQDHSDLYLTRLVERICDEIGYPLPRPTVAAISQDYFAIDTRFDLLYVPPRECDYLLHLPDIYHELGHPLLSKRYEKDAGCLAFQEVSQSVFALATQHLREQKQRQGALSGKAPQKIAEALSLWEYCWRGGWTVEFLCDVFALATLGPAFAWSHLHLCAKSGADIFELPTSPYDSHPADDARMTVLLLALSQMGFGSQAGEIQNRWQELQHISGAKAPPEFARCYPRALLKNMVDEILDGVRAMGCRIAAPDTDDAVHRLLNQAWEKFWNPLTPYVDWEKQAVCELRRTTAELCVA